MACPHSHTADIAYYFYCLVIKDELLSFVGIMRRYIQVLYQIKRSAAAQIASTLYPTVKAMKKISFKAFRSKLKIKACRIYKEIESLFRVEGDSLRVLGKKDELNLCERLLLNPRKFSMPVIF